MTITRTECELFATTVDPDATSLPDPLLADWLREYGRDDLADKLVGWWVIAYADEPELSPDKRFSPITLYRYDAAVGVSVVMHRWARELNDSELKSVSDVMKLWGGRVEVRQATANEVEHGVPYNPDGIKKMVRDVAMLHIIDRRSPHTARTNPGD